MIPAMPKQKSANFVHKATAKVDPGTIPSEMTNIDEHIPIMATLDIPDYNYTKDFEDRPQREKIEPFHRFMQCLQIIGEDNYFAQSTMEDAWDQAFKVKFIANYKPLHKRRPRSSFIKGVRFQQCRSIRVMYRHWRRHNDLSEGSKDEESEIEDEKLQQSLAMYLMASGQADVPAEDQILTQLFLLLTTTHLAANC